jgi:hypothetical protein
VYGYRDIDGDCVDCMTWDEALELALTYSRVSGFRYKVEGELIQHFRHRNIARYKIFCWKVTGLGEQSVGNQRTKGKTRSNGRAA